MENLDQTVIDFIQSRRSSDPELFADIHRELKKYDHCGYNFDCAFELAEFVETTRTFDLFDILCEIFCYGKKHYGYGYYIQWTWPVDRTIPEFMKLFKQKQRVTGVVMGG